MIFLLCFQPVFCRLYCFKCRPRTQGYWRSSRWWWWWWWRYRWRRWRWWGEISSRLHNCKSRRSSLLIIENIENWWLLINRKQSEHFGTLSPWKEFTGSRIFVAQLIQISADPDFSWSRFQLIHISADPDLGWYIFQQTSLNGSAGDELKRDPSSSAGLPRTPLKPQTHQLPGKNIFECHFYI